MKILARLGEALGVSAAEAARRIGVEPHMSDKQIAALLLDQVEQVRRRQAHVCCVSPPVANSLGVAADADLPTVFRRIGELRCDALGLGVRQHLGLPPQASTQQVLDSIGELRAACAARQLRRRQLDAEDLVDQAIADGKVPPAHREFYLRRATDDLRVARDVINSLPTIHAGGIRGRHDVPA